MGKLTDSMKEAWLGAEEKVQNQWALTDNMGQRSDKVAIWLSNRGALYVTIGLFIIFVICALIGDFIPTIIAGVAFFGWDYLLVRKLMKEKAAAKAKE
jgi:hypothetical protein